MGFSLGNVITTFKNMKSCHVQLGADLICVVPGVRKRKMNGAQLERVGLNLLYTRAF